MNLKDLYKATDAGTDLHAGLSTVYASSNQGESTHEQAKANMGNPAHSALVGSAGRVTHAEPAVGVWVDGAEESVAASHPDARLTLRLGAALAKAHNQKSFLHWVPDPKGPHVRYLVAHPNMEAPVPEFLSSGVPFATHLPNETHVVDFDGGALAKNVKEAAAKVKGHVYVERGHAAIHGHDSDRERAKQKFREILSGS